MALVPYISAADLSEDDKPLLKRPINLYRALANSPDGLRHYSVLGQWIRHKAQLDPRLRELAILQVGYITRSRYEFSHHIKIGHDFGVSDDDIAALIAANAGQEHGLGELETAVLTAAREITTGMQMSGTTWQVLRKHLSDARIVDLLIVISFYNAVVRILATLQIDVEAEYQHYLEAFPLPDGDSPAGGGPA